MTIDKVKVKYYNKEKRFEMIISKYEFMKSFSEKELHRMIENFKKKRTIHNVQYSTCPHTNELIHRMYHCVCIEYSDNE